MPSGRPRDRVGDLPVIRAALLRVVELVPERRIAGDVDQRETPVAGIGRKVRQPDFLVDAHALSFLQNAAGHARKGHASFVEQPRARLLRGGGDEALGAPRYVVAKAGHRRETRSGERLEEPAVRKAVPGRHQQPLAAVIHTRIELIDVVGELGRGDEIRERVRPVRPRIQRRDLAADRVLGQQRNLVLGERELETWNRRRREQAVREVAVPLGKRRYVGHAGDAFAEPRALVVGEEKHAIFRDRAAHRGAVLMPPVLRRRLVLRREVVLRVEGACSPKLVSRRRHTIRA